MATAAPRATESEAEMSSKLKRMPRKSRVMMKERKRKRERNRAKARAYGVVAKEMGKVALRWTFCLGFVRTGIVTDLKLPF